MLFYVFLILSLCLVPVFLLSLVHSNNKIDKNNILIAALYFTLGFISLNYLVDTLLFVIILVTYFFLLLSLVFFALQNKKHHGSVFINFISVFVLFVTGMLLKYQLNYYNDPDAIIDTSYVLDLFGLLLGFAYCMLGFFLFKNLLASCSHIIRLVVLVGLIFLISINLFVIACGKLANILSFSINYFISNIIDVFNLINSQQSYAVVAIVLLLIAFLAATKKSKSEPSDSLIQDRINQASALKINRLFLYNFIFTFFIIGHVLYWDFIGSKPPSISSAQAITSSADGFVHIKINKKLLDGNLHRYMWTNDNGDKVRFFVINKNKNTVYLSVTLDACVLCGNHGYVQQDKDIFCASCGVVMIKQSIGKKGGCNPIPINFTVNQHDLIIKDVDLINSASHFR